MEPLNPLTPEFKARSAELLGHYRNEHSYLRHELPGGSFLSVFSMPLARSLFEQDGKAFRYGGMASDNIGSLGSRSFFQDPPAHTRARSVIQRGFMGPALSHLRPFIEGEVADALSKVIGVGPVEVHQSVASKLGADVMGAFLGIEGDAEQLIKFTRIAERYESVGFFDPNLAHEGEAALADLATKLEALVTDKIDAASNRSGSLLKLLRERMEMDTGGADREMLIDIASMLAIAGIETIAGGAMTIIRVLESDSSLLAGLKAAPETAPLFVEEALRLFPPFGFTYRQAVEPMEALGLELHAGEKVLIWLDALNRDPSVFEDAETFVPNRKPNQHLSFGYGIHHCVGMALARMVLSSFLHGLINRVETVQASGADWITFPDLSPMVLTPREMHIEFVGRKTA